MQVAEGAEAGLHLVPSARATSFLAFLLPLWPQMERRSLHLKRFSSLLAASLRRLVCPPPCFLCSYCSAHKVWGAGFSLSAPHRGAEGNTVVKPLKVFGY